MKTRNIIEGLTILQKYRVDQDGYDCSAEHDVLYAYITDTDPSEEDRARLAELGWAEEEESWRAFV